MVDWRWVEWYWSCPTDKKEIEIYQKLILILYSTMFKARFEITITFVVVPTVYPAFISIVVKPLSINCIGI